MKRTIEMILVTLIIVLVAAFLGTTMTSCTSDDDKYEDYTLYAIVLPEGATSIDIIPQDYVLTLDNVIAANPKTGEFKLKNTERIDSRAFPIPTQYVIQFYAKNNLLFEAKLTSVISSALSNGVSFCHYFTDDNGMARYDLEINKLINEDGSIKDYLSEAQEQGIQHLFQILKLTGKISENIEYDFQY